MRTSRELLRSVCRLARVGLDNPSYTGRPGETTAAEQKDSDVHRARGHSTVQLGPEQHDPGPVPNLGLGTDAELAHTAAAAPQWEAESQPGLGRPVCRAGASVWSS